MVLGGETHLTAAMSKVSFRARALDSSKPLPIYYEEELPDISEYVAINRTVPQMPTGMEKEEETESHLQKVINARQNFKDTGRIVIPIPEAAIPVSDYDTVYQPLKSQPHSYIRVPGLGLDEEVPDYDVDSEDEEWLSVQSRERPLSPMHFERMMDKLEKGSGNTVLSDRDAQVLLKDDEDLVIAVYDYWLAKRLRLGRPLNPSVRNERRDGTSSSNPYLAFRKRTEKMQTRKNRKNDEQAYMHMLKLKRDLSRAITLVELVKEREHRKYDLALIQAEVFRKRYILQDWSGSLISSLRPLVTPTSGSAGRRLSTIDNKWEGKGLILKSDIYEDGDVLTTSSKNRRKKRKGLLITQSLVDNESPFIPMTPTLTDKTTKDVIREINEERVDVEELDGPFTFKRKIHLHYHKPKHGSISGLYPWDNPVSNNEDEIVHRPKRFCFSRTSINGRRLGLARRRVGRGGRSMWDIVLDSQEESVMSHDRLISDKERGLCSDSLTDPPSIPQEGVDELHVNTRTGQIMESRCPHFYPVSPKPGSTSYEFTYLPFIDPSTYPCPELNTGYCQFAGQTYNDEMESVSSFSSLPTSQFTLRPSSNLETVNEQLLSNENDDNVNNSTETRTQQQKLPQNVWNESRKSENEAASTSLLSVPSTHLSSLESSLPVHIHVNNLTHLPQKDNKRTNLTPPPPPPPLPPILSSTNENTDTGLAYKTSVRPQNEDDVTWFRDCPSNKMLLLNKQGTSLKLGQRLRRSVKVTFTVASTVTNQFKLDSKSESSNPSTPGVTNVTPKVPSSSSIPSPQPLNSNQHTVMSGLISDARRVEPVARDKKPLVTHQINHQKIPPNGKLNHHSKLPSESEREFKQALATGSVINNHSLVESSTNNSLVKLNTPEVT